MAVRQTVGLCRASLTFERVELRLQHSMISYLMLAKGYGAVEVAAPLQRTRELAAEHSFFVPDAVGSWLLNQAQEISATAMLEAKTLGERLGVAVTTMCNG